MYSTRPGLILGFHGCDKSVLDKVLNGDSELNFSENAFDWLGNGIYFWEYSPLRAFEYATQVSQRKKEQSHIHKPAVLGAVIDLGYCLDLIEFKNLQLLKRSFELFKDTCNSYGLALSQNKPGGSLNDLLLRELDCAVIESIHQTRREDGLKPYDSVKGVFTEGHELYPSAGFKEKNHIQVCIKNPNCIKGFFLPRELSDKHPTV